MVYIQNDLTFKYITHALNLFNSHSFFNMRLTHCFFFWGTGLIDAGFCFYKKRLLVSLCLTLLNLYFYSNLFIFFNQVKVNKLLKLS